MRKKGYPPGHLKEAEVNTGACLGVFDDVGVFVLYFVHFCFIQFIICFSSVTCLWLIICLFNTFTEVCIIICADCADVSGESAVKGEPTPGTSKQKAEESKLFVTFRFQCIHYVHMYIVHCLMPIHFVV